MASKVYFGSARQARWEAKETLPGKLDLIIDQLHLRDRVKGERVLLKMHLGHSVGYSTIHPLFVRKVVDAIIDGGGKPFIADITWDVIQTERRGYTHESLGCAIYPAAGPDDKYYYDHKHPFKGIENWQLAGMVQDASFLVNFAHVKGHPTCGFGAAFKNLALGCMSGVTRSAMHDTMHFDEYWFPDKCPDAATRDKVRDVCPFGGLADDKDRPGYLHLHMEQCNQCGRCLQVAPEGSLRIDPVNFHAFQEACAISTAVTMSTFEPGKAVHLNLATQMTPLCDCFGFTMMSILPDVGIFGSDDIVALDQATLDVTGKTRLIEENIPTCMEVHTREGHPFRWLHGPLKDPYKVVEYAEKLGLGTRKYELVDVYPVEEFARGPLNSYIAAR